MPDYKQNTEANQVLFDAVRDLNLPAGQYAITGSGPLGIRGLRKIGDVDIIVDDQLWSELADKYPVYEEWEVKKIKVPEDIEVVGEGSSFVGDGTNGPTVKQQLSQTDIIEGLPFVALGYIKSFKQHLGREKDHHDIKLIDDFLNENPAV